MSYIKQAPTFLDHELSQLIPLAGHRWQAQDWQMSVTERIHTVETGNVLFFPQLAFLLSAQEGALLNPQLADAKHKNISLDSQTHQLKGLNGTKEQHSIAHSMIQRYQKYAYTLVHNLFPHYQGKLRPAPTSLRLHRVETRQTSWRQDDTRLHIDAFPSRPNHGERILRVFANISPNKESRVWRIGSRFENIAQHFLPYTTPLLPGIAWLMHSLGITKRRRTPYDHIMLQLHDAMKKDTQYQRHGPQCTVPFPANSVWICYSDQVPHAVMSGQFMLEQTYFLSPKDMAYSEYAPLFVLEKICKKKLI